MEFIANLKHECIVLLPLMLIETHLHNLEASYHKAIGREREAGQDQILFKFPKKCTKIEFKGSTIHKTSRPSYRDLQVKQGINTPFSHNHAG